jgi:hypothetical protein
MDWNLYALEKQVEAKLRDARKTRAETALVSALRAGHRARFAGVAAVLARWAGGRAIGRMRPSADSRAGSISPVGLKRMH